MVADRKRRQGSRHGRDEAGGNTTTGIPTAGIPTILPPAGDSQRRARALGDPTRYRIFRYLADAGRPVGVAELTAAAGLNHNAVRQHLAKLRDAALVAEQHEPPKGPGRPRLVYEVTPEAAGEADTPGPYEWLAVQLASAVRHGRTARDAGREAGRAAAGPGTDGVAAIEAEMERHGFRPVTHDTEAGADVILQRCPFASAADADPATVCQLHLGLAEGVAEAAGDVDILGLRPKNPHAAGCELHLRRRG